MRVVLLVPPWPLCCVWSFATCIPPNGSVETKLPVLGSPGSLTPQALAFYYLPFLGLFSAWILFVLDPICLGFLRTAVGFSVNSNG